MDADALRARLILHVMAPLLEDIVEQDPEAAALVRGWNCAIRMQAGAGGPSVLMKFERGKLTAFPEGDGLAAVTLDFGSISNLNGNFGFPGDKVRPRVGAGIVRIIILTRFAKLLLFLRRYLKPREGEEATPEITALRARILMRLSVAGIPVIAEHDETAAPLLKNIPDGVCRWKILPDGPSMTVCVSSGKFSAEKGDARTADAEVDFKNPEVALGVLSGKSNPMKAMMSGDLAITGKTQIAMTLLPLQKQLGDALK